MIKTISFSDIACSDVSADEKLKSQSEQLLQKKNLQKNKLPQVDT